MKNPMNTWFFSLSLAEQIFFAALLSFLAGFLLSWLFQRSREQTRAAIAIGERARVEERLASAERESAELKSRVIPAAEEKIRQREGRVDDLMREVAALQAREAEVTTRLEEERQQAAEKLEESGQHVDQRQAVACSGGVVPAGCR